MFQQPNTTTCPKCSGKGGFGPFGPCSTTDVHFKKKCITCNGAGIVSGNAPIRCPKCSAKGGFGPFGACELNDAHFKRECPLCDGRCYFMWGENFSMCSSCSGKGGMGAFGPCEIGDVHFRSNCSICQGKGYTKFQNNFQPQNVHIGIGGGANFHHHSANVNLGPGGVMLQHQQNPMQGYPASNQAYPPTAYPPTVNQAYPPTANQAYPPTANPAYPHQQYPNTTYPIASPLPANPQPAFQAPQNCCTAKTHGRSYINQKVYNCDTCHLQGNEGCCEACATTCHAGHSVRFAKQSPKFFCDCGTNYSGSCKSLGYKQCTGVEFGRKYIKQGHYHCHTCNLTGNLGCCGNCARQCHAGHRLEFIGVKDQFFCDCGTDRRLQCKSQAPESHGAVHFQIGVNAPMTDPNSLAWIKVGGNLTGIACAGTHCWGVNNELVYRWNGMGWDVVPGLLRQIDVGSDETVWGISADSSIYRLIGCGGGRTLINGKLTQISVGSRANVIGLNAMGEVMRWVGGEGLDGWIKLPTIGVFISASIGDDGEIWAVDMQLKVWRWGGMTWEQIPGQLKNISVARAGEVYGTNILNDVYKWNNGMWIAVPGKMKMVSVGKKDLFVGGIGENNEVYQLKPESSHSNCVVQ